MFQKFGLILARIKKQLSAFQRGGRSLFFSGCCYILNFPCWLTLYKVVSELPIFGQQSISRKTFNIGYKLPIIIGIPISFDQLLLIQELRRHCGSWVSLSLTAELQLLTQLLHGNKKLVVWRSEGSQHMCYFGISLPVGVPIYQLFMI